jgi:hypothetical protein
MWGFISIAMRCPNAPCGHKGVPWFAEGTVNELGLMEGADLAVLVSRTLPSSSQRQVSATLFSCVSLSLWKLTVEAAGIERHRARAARWLGKSPASLGWGQNGRGPGYTGAEDRRAE